MRHRIALGVALMVSAALVLCPNTARQPSVMWLLSNEFAYHHHGEPGAVSSPMWQVTSGSLFTDGTYLWSGRPDDGRPGPTSTPWTDSAVLRAISDRDDFGDVSVSFDLRVRHLITTKRTPARDYDGVHIMLRYRSETSAYFVSVSRRDGRFAIKRKTTGGPSNGGTYVTLAQTPSSPAPSSGWRHVEASIRGSSTVLVTLRVDGFVVLRARESTTAATPSVGRVGLRGDNCDLLLRGFRINRPVVAL